MATASLNVIALISGGKDSFYSLLHCIQNGHHIVALANLYPPVPDAPAGGSQDERDLNSFMYQTVGHEVIPLYAEATGIPLYRQLIAGGAMRHERDYAYDASEPGVDETESMLPLLCLIKEKHPEANALCSGAILSTYQRTRVESIAVRLRLTPLAYLWQYTALPAPVTPANESQLLTDMEAAGLEARIIKVASAGLDESHLWEWVSSEAGSLRVKQALRKFGAVDGASLGEGGEFETLVLDGPGCLFKKSIVVPEQGMHAVREGGGSSWLSTRGAYLQDKDTSSTDSTLNARVPDLFDPKFAQILEDLVAQPHKVSGAAVEGSVAKPLSMMIPDHGEPELYTWTFISDESFDSSMITEETNSVVSQLKDALVKHRLGPAQLTTVIIVLRNMADFPKINQVYGGLFESPNPASRVTISCGNLLPNGRNIMLYATVPPAAKMLTRDGLHVQSRSYWAPANIGPYSQAIDTPITRCHVTLGLRSVYIAGQIPLIPHTMILPTPSDTCLAEQITLSLQHLWRIGTQMKVQQWTSVVAYFDKSASTEDMQHKAQLASRAWSTMHAELDEEDDDEVTLDPWDLKYNTQYMSLASHQSSRPRPLPDWEVFPMRQQNKPETCIPPFFAVEVEELPRQSTVEWHAHIGLAGLSEASTQLVSHAESQLDGWRSWNTLVRADEGIFVHTVLANVGRPRAKASVSAIVTEAQGKYRESLRLLGADSVDVAAHVPYLIRFHDPVLGNFPCPSERLDWRAERAPISRDTSCIRSENLKRHIINVPPPRALAPIMSNTNEAAPNATLDPADSATVPERSGSATRGRFRQRRQSKSERISEILQNARGRADEMGSDPATIRRHSSFGRKTQFADDDPDETTGIVSRGSSHNYQAVNTPEGAGAAGPPPGSGTRSIYSLRSRTAAAAAAAPPSAADEGDDEETRTGEETEKPWWRQQLGKYQSLELENKGSVARDHLALERTFLAWLRTSLAFASIGIAVTQLFRLNTSLNDSKTTPDRTKDTLRRLGRPLGGTFLGISILILLLGYKRYFHGQEWILKGKFPASRGTIVLVSLVGLAIMAASLVVVVVIHPADD